MRSTVGNYRTENIVTRGLVLHLDAGNPNSYYGPSNSTVWKDLSGNGNNGTLVNGAIFGNNSIIFDGVSDYVSLSDIKPIRFTFNFWLNIRTSRDAWVMSCQVPNNISNYDKGYTFRIDTPSDIFIFRIGTGSSFASRTASISFNQWINFTCTYDGSNMTLYKNNILISAASIGSIDYSNTINTTIGAYNNGGAGLDGLISIIQVYDRALPSLEISQNFNAQRSRFGI